MSFVFLEYFFDSFFVNVYVALEKSDLLVEGMKRCLKHFLLFVEIGDELLSLAVET